MKIPFITTLFAFWIIGVTTAASHQIVDFVEAARGQIGKTIRYDPSYQAISYPNGDVPTDRGVCTDVIIRALREAFNYDLQQFVHEDMKRNFSEYPRIWGLKRPDKNIDHRRVPNLQRFFTRNGWSLSVPHKATEFQPGDLVTCIVPPNLPHIMIVSDRRNNDNIPLVIHNIGNGTREENRLFTYELTGHYRIGDIQKSNNPAESQRLYRQHLSQISYWRYICAD